MEIIAQSSTICAEVRGLDLATKLSEQQFEQVNQAFLDYQIIFFTTSICRRSNTNEFALNDYHGYRRVMHCIIVEGERPQ